MSLKKTLIVTNSRDATVDLVISILGTEKVFRLNYDLWHQYNFEFNASGFSIFSQHHSISNLTIAKAYWRKPFAFSFSKDFNQNLKHYYTEELKYIFNELFAFCISQKKAVLVNPASFNKVGKLHQKFIAKKFFNVPDFSVSWNEGNVHKSKNETLVAKSLSSTMIGEKFLYTTAIEPDKLDISLPWFLEERIEAEYDLTIVFIAGSCFAYTFNRLANGNTLDWRQTFGDNTQDWVPFSLPKKLVSNIRMFMKELNLKYGRLDFLISKDKFFFLEVNVNGQWAWLDYDNKNGLLKAMCSIIDPDKPCLKKYIV